MSKTQTVFLVGATGNTGSSIADVLLSDSKFHVIAAVRPASASKPAVADLKARGAEIRIVDLGSSSVEQLKEQLKDVDTVISAITPKQIPLQKPLIHAAKKTGVKRFIPCDWATACVHGVMEAFDEKTIYQDLIKEIGLGYTFIDVGWWFQITLPIVEPAKEKYPDTAELTRTIFGTGEVKTALTDLRDVGTFVARIIVDERTLNKYVFCYSEQRTQHEIFGLAERITGKPIPTKQMSTEQTLAAASAQVSGSLARILLQYLHSMYIRGDNIVENAKKEEYGGALDVRELYPDIKLRSLEDFAKEYYSQ